MVIATYSFPAANIDDARKMAEQIATGQTLGYLPDDFESYRGYLATVKDLHFVSDKEHARAKISFPDKLFGTDIAGLLTVLFGKISFAPGIYLEEVFADSNYLGKLTGPRIGLAGIRKLAGVDKGSPLLMAILKPGIGPSNDRLAENYKQLVGAGTHLVKDDEVCVDQTTEAALRRLEGVLKAGGGKGLYVMALNGLAFDLRNRALKLQAAGAQAFLVCPYTYGLSVAQSLCQDPEIKVPLFMHPAFTGIMQSHSGGISPAVSLGTLMRWLGADAVLFPSPYGSIALSRADSISVHQELIKDSGSLNVSASVPSAGILPNFVKNIRDDFGPDVIVNAGTGMARSGTSIADGAKAFQKEISRWFGGES